MARYEIWHTDDAGNRLDMLNTALSFDYVLVDGDVGWLQVNMPYEDGRLYDFAHVDQRIQIYRAPDNGILQLVATGSLRKWVKATENNGMTAVRLGAADPNELLKRRIAAYYDRTNYTIKDDYADDMIKEIARENLGASATDAARNMAALGVSIQGDLSAGPAIYHAFAHENILAVFQEIQEISKAAGNEVFWRMRADSPTTFVLETYTGQPGRDRTYAGATPLYFGNQFGNIVQASLEELYDDEQNYIYAGGPGEGVLQIIQTASDAVAIGASRWNRREGYITATNVEYTYQVEDAARAGLTQKRPRSLFQAEIIPTPLTPFGGDGWWLGDKITVSHFGRQIDAIIRAVRVQVASNGMETVQARIEGGVG